MAESDRVTQPCAQTESKAKDLQLAFKNLTSLPVDQLLAHKETTALQIYRNKLTELPDEVFLLTKLVVFHAWENRLTEIPTKIETLSNLQSLEIHLNCLTKLPTTIGSLSALRDLRISHNQIASLPDNFSDLRNLEELSAGSNPFTSFPEQIFACAKLQTLELNESNLKHIPEQISKLKNLTELRLSQCNLHEIPASLCSLANLKSLFLDMNPINQLPPTFPKLTSLQRLHLDYTDLTTIPESFYQLPDLKFVSIGGCKTEFTAERYTSNWTEEPPVPLCCLMPFSFKSDAGFRVNVTSVVPDQIIKGLFLGSAISAKNRHFLNKANVTHVLTIMDQDQSAFPKDFKYLWISAKDVEEQEIKQFFAQSNAFIEEGRKSGGVVVHCQMGVSRSASLVIAYIMEEKKMGFTEAYDFVKSKREIIFPNRGFVGQLREYEAVLAVRPKSENCILC